MIGMSNHINITDYLSKVLLDKISDKLLKMIITNSFAIIVLIVGIISFIMDNIHFAIAMIILSVFISLISSIMCAITIRMIFTEYKEMG